MIDANHNGAQHDLCDQVLSETSACDLRSTQEQTNVNIDDCNMVTMNRILRRRVFEATVLLVSRIISHFWRMCTCGGLIVIIVWWMYGGWLSFFLFCLSVLGLLYHCQDILLYYPDQPATARLYVDLPSTVNLPYEEHYIVTNDGVTLNVILLKQKSSSTCQTILYLHGNAGNIGNRLINAHGLYTFCECNILLLEYRGYGKSSGSPNEAGLYRDAMAGMEFLLHRADIDHSAIVVFGRSLGGAVAVYLASSTKYSSRISGLIVENTFTSIRDIAQVLFHMPYAQYMPMIFIKNKYLTFQRMSQILAPTLFLSGLCDELIPPRMMVALYQQCSARVKKMYTYERGAHNDTWTCDHYYYHLHGFLTQLKNHRMATIENQVFLENSTQGIQAV